jgi:hypothetical protein
MMGVCCPQQDNTRVLYFSVILIAEVHQDVFNKNPTLTLYKRSEASRYASYLTAQCLLSESEPLSLKETCGEEGQQLAGKVVKEVTQAYFVHDEHSAPIAANELRLVNVSV